MKNWKILFGLAFVGVLCAVVSSCTEEVDSTTYFTTDAMTLTETLESQPDTYSEYVEVLKKTGYYSALKSYGNYTCFVPVNYAIKDYIQAKWGVNSVSELNTEEQIEGLKVIVKFHTMPSKKWTSAFETGRLPDTTFSGDFLTTSFAATGGIANAMINRQSKLLQYDVAADNGVIHGINKVLDPFVDGVATVMERGGKHSIFIEALIQTGYFDLYNQITTETGSKIKFTILAETDSVYNLSGITTFQDLANLISPDDSDFGNSSNPLNKFMAYHGTIAFNYSSDFTSGFMSTVAEGEALKVEKTVKYLRINETETGENDSWVSLVKSESNYPAKNGVYHTVDTIMSVFVPKASHIMWDPVSDQPEVQAKLIASHQKLPSTAWSNVTWYPEANKRYLRSTKNPTYNANTFDLGGAVWYEFITPIIPKGQYELLICAKNGGNARGQFQVYWDDEPIGSVYDVTKKYNQLGWPDSTTMEANGWRLGKDNIFDRYGNSAQSTKTWFRFIVTKELLCPEQKTHRLKLVTVKQGGIPLDYVEFIPVE